MPVGGSGTPIFLPTPTPGLGYGGAEYSFSPYGSGAFPRQPIPTTGGYGGAEFGTSSYGSVDITQPRVSSVVSLDGYRIEMFFSEEMNANTAFCDAASYTMAPILGAPATVTAVALGTAGTAGGYTSVILTHTGTTLGGTYTATATGIEDLAGNIIGPPGADTVGFLALGDTPTYTVVPVDGDTILFSYFRSDASTPQDMLDEAGFSPGIEDLDNYSLTTTYPISLTLGAITNPVSSDASLASMEVTSMTSAIYDVSVSPATAFLYDGSILPDAATNFTGVEVGTGSSTASAVSSLRLSKSSGDVYGWSFEDTSGKVLPSSTYRMDFVLNTTTAAYSPSLFDAVLGTLSFSDGAVQVDILINRVAGVDVLDISSGTFSGQVLAAWSSAATTISLVRNQKGTHYSILVNGTPVLSTAVANFDGAPAISPGARFTLSATYTVLALEVTSLNVTSSQTVFSSAYNFLHSVTSSFTGSAAIANDKLKTARGPLVKGWGDATPATKQDVEVRVNGTPVEVESVNPYTGFIFPTIPIPLAPPGTNTIEVDYKWYPSPPMVLAGLNTEGLVLNKWDLPQGHTAPSNSPLPDTATGAVDTARFPMGVVLGPLTRQQPIHIGHRYLGFEQEYTASLNSPTTLLLNQDPHRVSVPDLTKTVEGSNVFFDGDTTPPEAEDDWSLDGTDTGEVVGDGTYRLVDASSGTYEDGTAAVYFREEDLACPASVHLSGRLKIEDYALDGVFTGVGFGFHDNFRLYLVGFLVVNGVRHLGVLTNADRPQEVESWDLGPEADATIVDEFTFTIDSADLPSFVEPGGTFQILDGPQAGVYTIATCGVDDFEGTVTITLDPSTPFPADPNLFGNDTATVVFEVLWDEALTSFRMEVDTEARVAQLFVGSLSGRPLLLDDPTAIPADTALLIPTGDKGRIMFGSFSRLATNDTTWSFYRYATVPTPATTHARGIVVSAEMSDLPEDDPNNEWFITNRFGTSVIDSSGDTMLLKSTSSGFSYEYGYARIEPLLTSKVFADVDATFKVESGTIGVGDAVVRIRDDEREGYLTTLLYRETGGSPYRELVLSAVDSLSGLLTPEQAGWTESSTSDLADEAFTVHGQTLTLTKGDGEEGTWYTDLVADDSLGTGRIFEARLAILSYTAGTDDFVGPIFGGEAPGTTDRLIAVTFKASPARVVLTSSGTDLASFAFAWDDGEFHTYRVICNPAAGTVVVITDDAVLGTVIYSLFDAATDSTLAFVGASGSDAVSVSEWDSFSAQQVPLSSFKKTIGVWDGDSNRGSIDSYILPRTDDTSALNSGIGAIIEEMDWTELISVRLHWDPTWGLAVYRPDLPPPPGFTGDFTTFITDPTAAWINVEYRQLPLSPDMFGSVAFGALEGPAVTQQRWTDVRYRIYNTPDENFISPHHMVLNQYNVIHSGELLFDVTPEVVTVNSLTSTLVSVRSAHMNADRVFIVVVDDSVLPVGSWAFDPETQLISLIFEAALPSDSYPVTITFAPAKPVTDTYLCSQPLEGSVTLLNDGTPPIPTSQQAATTREVVAGSRINDPNDVLNDDPDFILNDPYRTVTFEQGPDSLYECLSFCTVDDGNDTGILSIACDGPAPEQGLIAIELSGQAYHDAFSVPGGPGGPWGSSSPSIKGSASKFSQASILHVSGGKFQDGVLGPGTAVMYPNYPGPNGPHRGQDMGVNQELKINLRVTIPYEDTLEIPATADNVPPTSARSDTDPNVDGTPGTQSHGAVTGLMEDGANTDYSRLGPWGGLSSLKPESLLAGGGLPPSGNALTLAGGAKLGEPTFTVLNIEASN